jgi:hypothetical protein
MQRRLLEGESRCRPVPVGGNDPLQRRVAPSNALRCCHFLQAPLPLSPASPEPHHVCLFIMNTGSLTTAVCRRHWARGLIAFPLAAMSLGKCLHLEMVLLVSESVVLTDEEEPVRLAFCLSWVVRSRTVQAHFWPPALMWNLRP